MESERRKALDRAEAAGYLPMIRGLAQKAAVPIWWSRSSQQAGNAVLHNGTVSAIDTGERRIAITADHVFSQYLLDKAQFDDIECQVGNVRVDLEECLIDHDEGIDLATFDIPEVLLAASGLEPHGAHIWPPSDLKESDIVILGGYPGFLRKEAGEKLHLPFVSFLARAAQVSLDHSAVQLNIQDSYWPDGSGGIPPQSDLGGMSGGPVFLYHRDPIEFFELAGIIYEASPTYELIFAKGTSLISEIGRVARGA